jgi:diguanylate cyclase (GGDEF)-like protein
MRSYIHNWVTPHLATPRAILPISILAMGAIFVVDLADGSQIWSQVLYLFPLCAIALSCPRFAWVLFAVLLALVFQVVTFVTYEISSAAVVANSIIALAAGTLSVAAVRVARWRFANIATAATTDVLTGLYNRRGFESVAEREIARQKRYGGVFSLVVLDLDRFKSLNDSKGHEAGDRALCLLGSILRDTLRDADSIARLGGDEFAIVMPNANETDCGALCQQLSATIRSQMDAAGFATTASIGYTTCETPPNSVAAALHEADEAMYAAKAMSSGLASYSRMAARQIPHTSNGPGIAVIRSAVHEVTRSA